MWAIQLLHTMVHEHHFLMSLFLELFGGGLQLTDYLLDAQQLWVIEEHEDAADDGPAQEVQREADQRQPYAPGCMTD